MLIPGSVSVLSPKGREIPIISTETKSQQNHEKVICFYGALASNTESWKFLRKVQKKHVSEAGKGIVFALGFMKDPVYSDISYNALLSNDYDFLIQSITAEL